MSIGGRVVPVGQAAAMRVSLTFDNGPHPEVTPLVLDELAKRGVLATFFVLGERLSAPGGAGLLARIRQAGHRVGNHTFSHTIPLGRVDAQRAVEEIRATEVMLSSPPDNERLFRPFGGRGLIGDHLLNRAAWDYLASMQYTCVLWNVLAREWDWGDSWAKPTVEEISSRDWSVVVMHDVLTETPQQLSILLEDLLARNVEFSQDFPDECIAMRRGEATGYPASIIAASAEA